MDPSGLLFVVLVVGGVLLVWFAIQQQKKRRAAFTALAQRLDMVYTPDAGAPMGELTALEALRPSGHSIRLRDVVSGEYKEREIECGQLHWVTGSGKSQQSHDRSLVIAKVPREWPWLSVAPENFLERAGRIFGIEDINFESKEFSDKFWVKCGDKKFAYDLIQPRTMELLLAHPGFRWEIRGGLICCYREGTLRPDEVESELDLVVQFLALVPSYAWGARAA